jgi:hypothetical protein
MANHECEKHHAIEQSGAGRLPARVATVSETREENRCADRNAFDRGTQKVRLQAFRDLRRSQVMNQNVNAVADRLNPRPLPRTVVDADAVTRPQELELD